MAKKKNKTTYDPKKAAFVICVGVIAIVILNMVYDKNHRTETWLVCKNEQNKYANYDEKVKYRFKGDELYGFYREEIISADDETNFKELYASLSETRDNISMNDDLSYELEVNGLELTAKTYIGVYNIPNYFDGYIQSTPIKSYSTLDDVKNYYESIEYECKISYK